MRYSILLQSCTLSKIKGRGSKRRQLSPQSSVWPSAESQMLVEKKPTDTQAVLSRMLDWLSSTNPMQKGCRPQVRYEEISGNVMYLFKGEVKQVGARGSVKSEQRRKMREDNVSTQRPTQELLFKELKRFLQPVVVCVHNYTQKKIVVGPSVVCCLL